MFFGHDRFTMRWWFPLMLFVLMPQVANGAELHQLNLKRYRPVVDEQVMHAGASNAVLQYQINLEPLADGEQHIWIRAGSPEADTRLSVRLLNSQGRSVGRSINARDGGDGDDAYVLVTAGREIAALKVVVRDERGRNEWMRANVEFRVVRLRPYEVRYATYEAMVEWREDTIRENGRLERFRAHLSFRKIHQLASSMYGPQHPFSVKVDHDIGSVLRQLNRPTEAQGRFRNALRSYEQRRESRSLNAVETMIELGFASVDTGDYAEAEQVLQEASRLTRGRVGDPAYLWANAQNGLAWCALERGDPREALRIAERGLQRATQWESDGILSAAQANEIIGLLHFRKGVALHRMGERDTEAFAAAEIAHQRYSNHITRPFLADLCEESDKRDEDDQPVGVARAERLYSSVFAGVYNDAQVLQLDMLSRGEFVRTISLQDIAERTAALRLRLEDPLGSAEAVVLGRATALTSLLRRPKLTPEELRTRLEHADLQGAFDVVADRLETQRIELVEAEEAFLRLQPDDDDWFETLAEVERERADMRAVRTVYRTFELRPELQADRLSFEETRGVLREGEVALIYTWMEDAVFVVALTSDAASGAFLSKGTEEQVAIGTRLAELRRLVTSDGVAECATEHLAALRAELLPVSVEPLIAGAERVLVVPDGPLGTVPLGAVFADLGSPVVFAPSLSLIAEIRLRDRPQRAAGVPILLGEPVYREQEGQVAMIGEGADQYNLYGLSLSPLPGTGAEVDAIATHLGEESVLKGVQASLPALRARIDVAPPRMLHIATHGLMGTSRSPLDASVALTAPDRMTSEDTGFLTLDELFWDWKDALFGCELVVLSACDTGRGVQAGDSQLGLPWGFFYAGADAVVASLWPVDDAATALLMARFHENRAGAYDEPRLAFSTTHHAATPMPTTHALDEAQRWLRTTDKADVIEFASNRGVNVNFKQAQQDRQAPYDHPFYWAPFIVIGDGDAAD